MSAASFHGRPDVTEEPKTPDDTPLGLADGPGTPEERQRMFDSAVEYHGTTDDLQRGAYILPDGRLLDIPTVKGRTGRHPFVQYIDRPMLNEDAKSRFIRGGAIRYDAEGRYTTIGAPPTPPQIDRLRQFMRHRGPDDAMYGTCEVQFELLGPGCRDSFSIDPTSEALALARVTQFFGGEHG
jgi:hypothetical protein